MFKLPPLPYEKNAFPHQISVETFDYHYGKHHQTYINSLNDALANTPAWQDKSLEEIIMKYPCLTQMH
jgi:superoxide dismutase, Fe-Mn family